MHTIGGSLGWAVGVSAVLWGVIILAGRAVIG
jgi:hypothetical protein